MANFANRRAEMYVELTEFKPDGSTLVYRFKCRSTPDSDLTLDLGSLIEEYDEGHLPVVSFRPTGRQNVKIDFTNCELVNPE